MQRNQLAANHTRLEQGKTDVLSAKHAMQTTMHDTLTDILLHKPLRTTTRQKQRMCDTQSVLIGASVASRSQSRERARKGKKPKKPVHAKIDIVDTSEHEETKSQSGCSKAKGSPCFSLTTSFEVHKHYANQPSFGGNCEESEIKHRSDDQTSEVSPQKGRP